MKPPTRGEVWLVDLGLAAKIRPCLVLSVPFENDERSLVTLVPHTTAMRDSRFEAKIDSRALKPGAFDAQGIVSVPAVRLIRKLISLPPEQMQVVESCVSAWLGLNALRRT